MSCGRNKTTQRAHDSAELACFYARSICKAENTSSPSQSVPWFIWTGAGWGFVGDTAFGLSREGSPTNSYKESSLCIRGRGLLHHKRTSAPYRSCYQDAAKLHVWNALLREPPDLVAFSTHTEFSPYTCSAFPHTSNRLDIAHFKVIVIS